MTPADPTSPQGRTLSAQQVWEMALAAHRGGQAEEAERLYRALQASQPTPPTALNLGLLLEDQRRWAEAECLGAGPGAPGAGG